MSDLSEAIGIRFEKPDDSRAVESAVELIVRGFSEGRKAERHVAAAQSTLSELNHYIESNWDAEYDELLRESGFGSSLVVMGDYAEHLDRVQQTVTAFLAREEPTKEAVSTADPKRPEEILRTYSPSVQRTGRAMCDATIRLLEFEHGAAKTRYVYLAFKAK
jgi:hypothetical protein